jgi:hypothetical protein
MQAALAALALVVAALPERVQAQADCSDGLAVVLSEGEVGTLQGPTFTTQILRGSREMLLVTRETGAGAPRDAYLFARSATGWTRVSQLATKDTRIEGVMQDDVVILFCERGQALMQIKLAELRFPEGAPAAPEAPAQQPPAQAAP